MARKKETSKSKHISVRITPEEFEIIEEVAYQTRRTISSIIQEMIETYVSSVNKQGKKSR
jgi:predicted DNA-binding protein